MRTALALLPMILALGCTNSETTPTINRIEMRRSGWSAVDVSVNSRGEGQYHLSQPSPNGASGSFTIPAEKFSSLVRRLEPFRKDAVPVTAESTRRFAVGETCPQGTPSVTDAGAVWVHWVGPRYDEHYLADLGCDPQRNAERNDALLKIVASLPVPHPKG